MSATGITPALGRQALERVAAVLLAEHVGRFDAEFVVGFLLGRAWRRVTGVSLVGCTALLSTEGLCRRR
jgi:hypothetical protein